MRTALLTLALILTLTGQFARADECSSKAQPGDFSGAVGGCSISPESDRISPAHAPMKGLELYCWRESGAWYFSLVPGKNAETGKTEILSAKMRGTYHLKQKMRKLPAGTTVALNPRKIEGIKLSAIPENLFQDLQRVAKERKLGLLP